ncbi:MAG: hypothetical protein NVV68_06750 [Dokdonella sp.]|nr:hypothetical protein [Dokdonella sp.]
MRYLGNNTNIVREAALTATNLIPSDAIYRTDTRPNEGAGRVELVGPFTGASNTDVDIEIVDNDGGTAQVSQPTFVGAGSGSMIDVAAAGIDPQSIVVTLEDLGTETLAAGTSFQGATLRARASGAGGNAITIRVDHSAITSAAANWSLQEELREGVNEYVGDHWNFGAAVLEPAGTIPVDAPRIRFGADPQVYRPYRRYREGRYVYGFSPTPVRSVPVGARVRVVTGTRSITISNGVTTEQLAGVTTLYDALSAIRDASALVDVVSPIVNDRLPGGQGITELSERTDSYVLSVAAAGSAAVQVADLDVSALSGAPTETLAVKCIDAGAAGAEKWEVRGDVSGLLSPATTGIAYADGRYTLTIPLAELDPSATTGMMVVEYLPSGTHPEGLPLPSLCVDRPRLGINAVNGEWEYTRVKRPPEECDCTTGELQGGPRNDCLGINDNGGTTAVSEESRLIRLQRLTAAVRELVGSNTSPTHSVAVLDVRWIQGSAAIFQECLRALVGGTLALPSWEPETAYEADAMREPTVPNGYRYAAQAGGESDDTEPTWPTAVGDTVIDGDITWECIGEAPWKMYDDAFDAWLDEVTELSGIGRPWDCSQWAPDSTLWSSGGLNACYPTERNGRLYRVSASGGLTATTGPLEPTWPTIPGARVGDNWDGGGIQWYTLPAYWEAESSVSLGKVIDPGVGVLYRAATAGETGGTEPEWGAASIIDGTVEWETIASSDLPVSAETTMDTYFEKWRTSCTHVLAAAGIERDFRLAGANGDGCWQDHELPYHWVYDGTEPFMPLQDGYYHHESAMGMDAQGRPYVYSTKRWGFGLRWGCPDALAVNDRIRITITGVSGAGRGYQEGDVFRVRTNQAQPLPFSGGQTGDDTLTWSVVADGLGRLPDYALVTTSPAPYAWADAGASLTFAIRPGGIRYALGDRYYLSVEAGRFRWRRDGGAWSSPIDIAGTAIGDGLSAVFTGGVAPSWAPGDQWSFRAEAVYGVDQCRQPVDGEIAWIGSTVIDIEPDGDGAIVGLLLAEHRIPDDATIRLQGSDDGFATTSLDLLVPWRRHDIWLAVTASHAAYRLLVDRGGALRWLWLGTSTQMRLRTGAAELGRLTKRRRLPSIVSRATLGASVSHSWLPQSSVDELFALLEHAAEQDDGLFAIVPNDGAAEVGLVRCPADTIELTDLRSYQPRAVEQHLQALDLTLEAA